MVLLVFLVDTSASMNQKTCLGTSYLDLAKGAVESFLKIRARDTNASRGDRYMLVTYAEPTKAVKAGWRENLQVFMRELKNLNGFDLSNVGCSLKETFDLLNMHRLQSGIDNYGMGRNPYYLEPALVLLLTDGNAIMDINGMIPEISIPTHNLLPGGELTTELYRWDQRLFTINLKIPGFASSVTEKLSLLQPEDIPLSNMCELTGGKLYNVGSHKSMMQSLESIAQKIMTPGVIINFEKHGPDPEELPREAGRPITPKLESVLSPAPEAPMEVDSRGIEHDQRMVNGVPSPLLNNQPIVSNHMNGDINMKMEPMIHMQNGIPKDPPQMISGPMGGRGLLPDPVMPPIPPLMASPLQMRGGAGLLPPPPIAIIPPYAQNNKIIMKIPPMLPPPRINGSEEIRPPMIDVKTEGQNTSSPGISDCPIRGDEQPNGNPVVDSNRNVLSPNLQVLPSTAWQKQRRMIFVRTNVKGSVGHWPIPEGFWPTSSTTRMPPRNCHPSVKYHCSPSEPMVIDNLPFDKYELEPSPLTQFILERKQPNVAWQGKGTSQRLVKYPFSKRMSHIAQSRAATVNADAQLPKSISDAVQYKNVMCDNPQKKGVIQDVDVKVQTFVSGSSQSSELGYAFGYLKAATNLQCVNLFVLPYNYTIILPLLDELFKVHKCKPTVKWRQAFEEYLKTMPSYYANPLRNALRRMGCPTNLIPDHYDGSLSYSVVSYLKKVKHQAKNEAERLAALHSQQVNSEVPNFSIPSAPQLVDGKSRDFKELLIQKTTTAVNKELYQKLSKNTDSDTSSSSELFRKRFLPHPVEKFVVESFKNPFDMSRDRLLQQVNRMRANFFLLTAHRSRIQDEDTSHRISISQMGNYQEHIHQNKPLREVDPSQARVHTFGNPFKLKQDQIIAIDEADVNENIPVSPNQNRKRVNENQVVNSKNKRKRSETPPPSRRPVGPPNTPPPKTENMIKPPFEPIKQALQDLTKKSMNTDLNGLNEIHPEKRQDNNKKLANSVNQQLRKLQEMRRKKDGLSGEKLEDTGGESVDSDSPILSILRTSLGEQEEKDLNDELITIHEHKHRQYDSSSNSSSTTHSNVPTPAIKFEELSHSEIRKANLQLQQRDVIKLRLTLWKGIRERKDFTWMKGLLLQLSVSVEAKYLFITRLIEEAERFQLQTLCSKFRSLLPLLRKDS